MWGLNLGVWRHKGTLKTSFSGIVGLRWLKPVNVLSDSVQELVFLIDFRQERLNIVRSLSPEEVDESEIFQEGISFSDKLAEKSEFVVNCFRGLLDLLFVLLPEILLNFGKNITMNTIDRLNLSRVLDVLAEKLWVIWPSGDISLDGIWLGNHELSILQIWDIGEGCVDGLFVLFKPFLSTGVDLLLKR